jgi:hypothetical protein
VSIFPPFQKYAAVAIFPHNFEIVTVQRKTGKKW